MDTRARTLAALALLATGVAGGLHALRGVERHLVRGESMVPTLAPRDTVLSIPAGSWLGTALLRRRAPIAVIALPWEHDLLGVKRLVARPGRPWRDGEDHVGAGPGWVAVGDQRELSTDSRHHGRVPDEAVLGVVIARIRAESGATATR